jgi:hypothetical protein
MKKFEFRLGRVLDWRRTQAGLEEMKLGRLQAELRDIENRITQARAEQSDFVRAILESAEVRAEALAALDSFKKSVAAECARLEGLASAVRRRIAQQLAIVAAKRRDARLLEKIEASKPGRPSIGVKSTGKPRRPTFQGTIAALPEARPVPAKYE